MRVDAEQDGQLMLMMLWHGWTCRKKVCQLMLVMLGLVGIGGHDHGR